MSEYQNVDFAALGRTLNDNPLASTHRQSTRAEVTHLIITEVIKTDSSDGRVWV
jgi:hypothetical protein